MESSAVFGVLRVTNYKEAKYNATGKLLSITYKNLSMG